MRGETATAGEKCGQPKNSPFPNEWVSGQSLFGYTNFGKCGFNETESMKRRDDVEPYWQDEDDGLSPAEFLPSNDTEGRVFCADIIGYLLG